MPVSQTLDADTRNRTPLPGMVTCFLVLLYPQAFSFFFLYSFAEALSPFALFGTVLYSLGMFCLGVLALVLIVGIYTRASWVPEWSRYYCLGNCLFFLIVSRQLFVVYELGAMLLSSYLEIALFFSISFIVINFSLFWAWWRYFSCSPKALASFGVTTPFGKYAAVPLGIGLLRVLCSVFILFFLVFCVLFGVFASLEATSLSYYIIGVFSIPLCLLPALVLFFSYVTNRSYPFLLGSLVLWLFFLCLAGAFGNAHILTRLAVHFGDTMGDYSYYMLETMFTSFPLLNGVTLLFLAVLVWRFLTVSEERRWLGCSTEAGSRFPNRFTGYYTYLCYILLSSLPSTFMIFVLGNEDSSDTQLLFRVVFGIGLLLFIFACVCLWRHCRNQFLSREVQILFFSVFIFYSFLEPIVRAWAMDTWGEILIFMLPYLIWHLVACCLAGVALRDLYNYRLARPLAMPLPVYIFSLLCVGVALPTLLSVLFYSWYGLFFAEFSSQYQDFYQLASFKDGIGSFLLSFDFLFAYCLLPAFLLWYIRQGMRNIHIVYALCAVWLFVIVSSFGKNIIVMAFEQGFVGITRTGVWQMPYILIGSIAVFIAYVSSSEELFIWRQAKQEERHRVLQEENTQG